MTIVWLLSPLDNNKYLYLERQFNHCLGRINLRNIQQNRRRVAPIKLGPEQEFIVEGLTHDAKGVARLNGKVTFIKGALPGEKVKAQVTKPGKNFDVAKLNHIIELSPNRVTAQCQHYEQCGGCSFQHLATSQQLEAKRHWLSGQLRKVINELPINSLSDRDFAYRRRARIAVFSKDGKTTVGFRGEASNRIIAIDNCIVLTEPLQRAFKLLKEQLHTSTLASQLGHIELLDDELGVSVLFRLTETLSPALKEEWRVWAEGASVTIYWQPVEAKRALLATEDWRRYVVDDLTLHYHPQDFIQVNANMNNKMVGLAMDWLAPNENDVVLDLFCGVGNFSLPLAKRAKKVIGVEVQESMVAAGEYNALNNGLTNLSFIAADLTQPIAHELNHYGVTKILLDPPRAGAMPFLDTIIKLKPKQILYVSCDAATLARDAEYLVNKGFKVLRVTIMNMFPHTSHVETMMLLEQ